ncbi:DUF4398 domain-containing protein [Luteimonas sp. SJ-92]|uniref:DUF4398 domain-containing protein n=1 Tax=Luteimonas salinisoli TaxID=2752307 RepID=A0A853J979_9GAMM|nr:DUF4398 domain-containing protein [Luteimonas salinisoli]NZA25332.1 DUF4398 domain-containing protein [Luteimonas salinisoli]
MSASIAQFRAILQASALGIVLALTACASLPPPTAELADAQRAVVRAADADADQYAPDELAQARGQLAQAQSAMAAGREQDARSAALAAAALGDLAHARSREAVANAQVAQRRAQISRLREQLGMAENRE